MDTLPSPPASESLPVANIPPQGVVTEPPISSPTSTSPSPQPTPSFSSSPPSQPPPKDWFKMAIAGSLAVITLFLVIGGSYFLLSQNNSIAKKAAVPSPTPALQLSSISGTIDLNGKVPDKASISISERKVGDSQFATVVTGVAAKDGAAWQWNAAQAGVAYELKASLSQNGKDVAQSDSQVIAAPAVGETVRINVPASSTSTVPVSISGTLDLNGFIPQGSTVAISARKVGESAFAVITTVPAVDHGAWSWTNALEGAQYEMQAALSGTSDQSQVVTISAPAANEIFTINSSQKPPVPAVVGISGKFNLNGMSPANSFLSIGVRKKGEASFNQVATNLPAVDQSTWSWAQAASGQAYDLQAYLWTNNTPASSSQILTITAPAADEILSFNLSGQPSTSQLSTPSTNCQNMNSSNQWQVQFNINTNNAVSYAQVFLLTVGTNSGGNQILNNIITPSNFNNPGQQSYTSGNIFNNGQTYYAQWSYASCPSCTYSQVSTSQSFSCNPASPTNTPTPTPTNAPTSAPAPTSPPAPTAVPTNPPVPTNTPPPPTNGVVSPSHTPTP